MSRKVPVADYPELLKEWNYEKNAANGLYPENTPSHYKDGVWWKCSEGHEWFTDPGHRLMKGSKCPYCTGRYAIKGVNDLATKYPEIAKAWNYEKNGDLTPDIVTYGSDKRVEWICSRGHEWAVAVSSRTGNDSGCPYCAGRKVLIGFNDLASKRPELAEEWHPKKNGDLQPTYFTEKSNKSVWWKCKDCGYEWPAKISNRANGRGCACCARKVVVPGINDLATTHPKIAAEWDYEKNGSLKPNMVLAGQATKCWWKCSVGHSYPATLNHRTSGDGTGCPECNSGRQTSFAEQAVYYYVKKVFPDALGRYKEFFDHGMELDIYIPSLKLGIEYDGVAWHKEDRADNDFKKFQLCKDNDVKLLRIVEKTPDYIHDICDESLTTVGNVYEHKNLEVIIRALLDKLDPISNMWMRKNPAAIHSSIDVNIKRDELEIRQYMTALRSGSLAEAYPEIAKEWHPTKNGDVTPNKVKPGSDFRAWWVCPDCGYEYKTTIGQRTGKGKTGCKQCGIKKVAAVNSRAINMLDLNTRSIIRTFASISEAARELKLSTGNLTAVCNHKRKQTGGYGWEYAEK